MQEQFTPKTENEQPKGAEQIPLFVKDAEKLQKGLGVEEAKEGEWKAILETLHTLPKAPEGKMGTKAMEKYLEQQLEDMEKQRVIAEKALLAGLSLLQKGELTENQKVTILLQVAEYMDMRMKYELREFGKTEIFLPPYLAERVKLEGAETSAVGITKYILPMQYDVAEEEGLYKPEEVDRTLVGIALYSEKEWKGESPRRIAPSATEIAKRMIQIDMPYITVERIWSKSISPEELMQEVGYRNASESDIRGAKLLMGYLRKKQKTVERAIKILPNMQREKLTMGDVFEFLHDPGLGELAGDISRELKEVFRGEIPDIQSITEKYFQKDRFLGEKTVAIALAPLLENDNEDPVYEKEEYKENFLKDAQEVMKFMKGETEMRMKSIHLALANLNNPQRKMVLRMREKLASGEAKEQLLRSLMFDQTDSDEMELQGKVEKAITPLLEGELIANHAFDIYYLLYSGADTSLLQGFKVTNLLHDYGHIETASELQSHLIGRLTDMADMDMSELDEMFKNTNLSDEQKAELRNVAFYMEEEGVDKMNTFKNDMINLCSDHPWLIPIIGVNFLGVAWLGAKGVKGLVGMPWRMRRNRVIDFENLSADDPQIEEIAKRNGVPKEQVQIALKRVKEIMASRRSIKERGRWIPFVQSIREGHRTKKSRDIIIGMKRQDLAKLATAIGKWYKDPKVVAGDLFTITQDKDVIRKALVDSKQWKEEQVEEAMQFLPDEAEANPVANPFAAPAEGAETESGTTEEAIARLERDLAALKARVGQTESETDTRGGKRK